MYVCIKTNSSESQGQEKAAYAHVFSLHDHYSELFASIIIIYNDKLVITVVFFKSFEWISIFVEERYILKVHL